MKINKLIALTTAVTMLFSMGGGYNLNKVYASESTSTISIENPSNALNSYTGTGTYKSGDKATLKGIAGTGRTLHGWLKRLIGSLAFTGLHWPSLTSSLTFSSLTSENRLALLFIDTWHVIIYLK